MEVYSRGIEKVINMGLKPRIPFPFADSLEASAAFPFAGWRRLRAHRKQAGMCWWTLARCHGQGLIWKNNWHPRVVNITLKIMFSGLELVFFLP